MFRGVFSIECRMEKNETKRCVTFVAIIFMTLILYLCFFLCMFLYSTFVCCKNKIKSFHQGKYTEQSTSNKKSKEPLLCVVNLI